MDINNCFNVLVNSGKGDLIRFFELLRLRLHGAIYRPNSFVMMLRYCGNLKAMRYESTSLNRIVADKSDSVMVPLG